MSQLFPYANIVSGILILIIGFGFHWIGQIVSVLNWELGTKIGLQEKELIPEYKIYEHAIAVADSALGWIYGIAAVGLIFNFDFGYKLAWIPGSILLYHSISAWVWEGNRRAAGKGLWSDQMRIGWCTLNALTGLLALAVAEAGKV